ncbi:MAG: hypothetical protein Q9214_000528 [Letrouitia sp. 1 TL-2023]
MGPQRAILILVALVTLTFLLTLISLIRSRPERYAIAEPNESGGSVKSFFSFRSPSALFPSSAIISLTDDNSTFFLARPADFGPALPLDGLSGQLWVGSGFGDDNLGRGIATDAEGELGCSDVPGWRDGSRRHHDDSGIESSGAQQFGDRAASSGRPGKRDLHSFQQGSGTHKAEPSKADGTDDHLHHPLPSSSFHGPSISRDGARLQSGSDDQPAEHADIQSLQESAEIAGKHVLLSRGGCGFLEKVKWVQRRGGVALIVGDNTRGGALVTMYARGDTSNITIPSLFTSRTTAHLLSSLIPPESLTNHVPPRIGAEQGQNSKNPKYDEISSGSSQDRPIFTSIQSAMTPMSTSRLRTPIAKSSSSKSYGGRRASKGGRSIGWFRSLFQFESSSGRKSSGFGALEDSRRPPSSGRLTWINEQWTEKALKHEKDGKSKLADGQKNKDKASVKDERKSSSSLSLTDEFEIGVQDWRDPDLVGSKGSVGVSSATATTTSQRPTLTAPGDARQGTGDLSGDRPNGLSGGIITPGSGEYLKPELASPVDPGDTEENENQGEISQSWLGRILWGDKADDEDVAHVDYSKEPGPAIPPVPISTTISKQQVPGAIPSYGQHEGLWVTLTPTTMSTSPFFDTLLVLVVSPLVTLTVVYSLLLIRSRIRRRRWRAPKSVVDQLPIRTYHTMSFSPASSSSPIATPKTSSPASPLLQSSPRSFTSRSCTRSHTVSTKNDSINIHSDTANIKTPTKEDRSSGSATGRRYHGKQIECVVCLEEYVDGHSKVMSLPCGHEFHADCITPWLITRRRTCPICKGDVVRSIAQQPHKGPREAVQAPYHDVPDPDEVQVRAAETSNDSPSAAIPIPTDGADLERGDDMAATLVNDEPAASSSRGGWRGLALSLSAFSGEAAWRQTQADGTR